MSFLRIKQTIPETHDAVSFVLESMDNEIQYKAGQFLTLLFRRNDGKEDRRSYSISSSPVLNEPLSITVKRIPNGEYSRRLTDKTNEGDLLQSIGASGFFVLPDKIDPSHTFVFLAAGSGITPEFSLIKTILHSYRSNKILLIYSSSSKDSTIFYSQLINLQLKYPGRFTIEFLFSRQLHLKRSRLSSGLLEEILYKHEIPLHSSFFYVCGPLKYMLMITFTLMALGAPGTHIKKEIFHIQHPIVPLIPPDTSAHLVTLIQDEKEYIFSVQFPITILQAAKLHGITIPFSCESGQCGTCVAKCLQGTVWMAQNEVLLEQEILDGAVLTCTGYPVNGDVLLKI